MVTAATGATVVGPKAVLCNEQLLNQPFILEVVIRRPAGPPELLNVSLKTKICRDVGASMPAMQ